MAHQALGSEATGTKQPCYGRWPLTVHEMGREHCFFFSQLAFRLFVVLAFLRCNAYLLRRQEQEETSEVFGTDVSDRKIQCSSIR